MLYQDNNTFRRRQQPKFATAKETGSAPDFPLLIDKAPYSLCIGVEAKS
jgi:hypothetical protein